MKKAVFFSLCFLILSIKTAFAQTGQGFINLETPYSFIVAGHTYGSHAGKNLGLYPKFFNYLLLGEEFREEIDFLILTGDIVRTSDLKSWNQTIGELGQLQTPFFLVMGNHDSSQIATEIFRDKYGDTYYHFSAKDDLFIILNSQIEPLSISQEQIDFTRDILSNNQDVSRVFIFFHELLWNSDDTYKLVKANSRSRYDNLKDSNYWSQIHPLFRDYPETNFFVVAGDVAGNLDAIEAFYDKRDNVSLIASGMGEIQNENFLKITVTQDDLQFRLIPLNKNNSLKALQYYTPDKISTEETNQEQNNQENTNLRSFIIYSLIVIIVILIVIKGEFFTK